MSKNLNETLYMKKNKFVTFKKYCATFALVGPTATKVIESFVLTLILKTYRSRTKQKNNNNT